MSPKWTLLLGKWKCQSLAITAAVRCRTCSINGTDVVHCSTNFLIFPLIFPLVSPLASPPLLSPLSSPLLSSFSCVFCVLSFPIYRTCMSHLSPLLDFDLHYHTYILYKQCKQVFVPHFTAFVLFLLLNIRTEGEYKDMYWFVWSNWYAAWGLSASKILYSSGNNWSSIHYIIVYYKHIQYNQIITLIMDFYWGLQDLKTK